MKNSFVWICQPTKKLTQYDMCNGFPKLAVNMEWKYDSTHDRIPVLDNTSSFTTWFDFTTLSISFIIWGV